MIFIIHGENYARSREYVGEIKEKVKAKNVSEISVEDVTPVQLFDVLTSGDIFGNNPFVVFDISNAGRKNMDAYINFFEKVSNNTLLIIITSKELAATNVFIKNSTKLNAKIINNKAYPTSNVFAFVDSVFAFDRTGSYKELHKLTTSGEDQIGIFSMMVWSLRNIANAKLNSAARVQPRFYSIAKRFSEDDIKYLYDEFYTLDKNVKLGLILQDILVPTAIEKVQCLKHT